MERRKRVPIIKTEDIQHLPLTGTLQESVPDRTNQDWSLTNEEESGIIQTLPLESFLTTEELAEVDAQIEQFGISSSGFPSSRASINGHTYNSTIIANTVSVPLWAFVQAGLIALESENVIEDGNTVTTYKAVFTDRDREVVITEETYRIIEEGIEVPLEEALSDSATERVQTSIDPIVQDRFSSLESERDGRGNLKTYSEDERFPARRQS